MEPYGHNLSHAQVPNCRPGEQLLLNMWYYNVISQKHPSQHSQLQAIEQQKSAREQQKRKT